MHRALMALALLALAACAPRAAVSPRFDLIVENQCRGADQSVYFYINGEFRGTVRGSRLFPGLPEARYELRAVGSQAGAKTFNRELLLNRDTIWTLCP